MARIYYPGELPNRGFVPHMGGILPGTPVPTIVGNPHLRGGPFVCLPGYGMEGAEAVTNMVVDPDFPDLTNWVTHNTPTSNEVGSQFAMDQGEFFSGYHCAGEVINEGKKQSIAVAASTAYAGSVWCKAISGVMSLLLYDNEETTEYRHSTTKIGEWQRLHREITTGAGTSTVVIYCITGSGGGEGYFWMPQWETGTYAKPARVGAQPASCIYVPSPISESQTPWSALCVVTPDWAYDTSVSSIGIWSLREGANDYAYLLYDGVADKWTFRSAVGGVTAVSTSATSSHSRGDKIQLVVTCDGYNANLYTGGVAAIAHAIKSAQPIELIVGALNNTAALPFNGVIDDFAFIEGCAIPSFKVKELYQKSKRGIPLHGLLDFIDLI